jgi:pilus assembly protein Flp/PilA
MLERYVYDVLAWWETQKSRAAEGQGLVEYALIIALVSIALIVALTALAGGIRNVFSDIQVALSSRPGQ